LYSSTRIDFNVDEREPYPLTHDTATQIPRYIWRDDK
jgi:hypothetical protein